MGSDCPRDKSVQNQKIKIKAGQEVHIQKTADRKSDQTADHELNQTENQMNQTANHTNQAAYQKMDQTAGQDTGQRADQKMACCPS